MNSSHATATDAWRARRFIGYLDAVINAVPERDAADPDQYLDPVEEPERFPLL